MPDNVVKLMEDIKHFFSAKNCIFIIGVDKEIISKGIKAKYGTSLISGEEYLEKIINLSFEIPLIINDDIAGFINAVIAKVTIPEWHESIKVEIGIFTDIVVQSNTKNVPRKLKFVITRFLFYLISNKTSGQDALKAICTLLIYKGFFPKLYEYSRGQNSYIHKPSRGGQHLPDEEIQNVYGQSYLEEMHEFDNLKYEYIRKRLRVAHTSKELMPSFTVVDFLYSLA